MGCPGLHCPGCTEGQSLAITGGAVVGLVLAAETVQWIAERVWWIGGTMAACLALSVAASMWLERWADRRGARFAAAHGILSRADVVLPEPARRHAELAHVAEVGLPRPAWPAADAPQLPAIENHVHYHVHVGEQEAAAIGPDEEGRSAWNIRSST